MKNIILTDSSSDLPLSYVTEKKEYLNIIGMPVSIEEEEFVDDLGLEFSHDTFYGAMEQGIIPKTSQINTVSFYERFNELHEAGYQIIYIGLSSGLSGTFNNAYLAKGMMEENVNGSLIEIIDSQSASIGLGAIIIKAVQLMEDGQDIEYIKSYIENIKIKANHWFVVDDLHYLRKGGRIPASVAYLGNMINIKPILSMDNSGKLEIFAKMRGKNKSYRFILSKLVDNIGDSHETIIIGHAHTPEDADFIEQEIRKKNIENPIVKTCLSATIASHVGPGMMAVAFIGNKDREKKE